MSIGLLTGASSMRVLEDWQSTIAHNLANASTPGFQKSSFQISGKRVRPVAETEGPTEARTVLPTGLAVRRFGMGEIKVTDNPYEMAIHGEGFFAVQGEGGQTLYTRDGEFHRSEEGVLVNKMGYPVLADGGIIELDPTEGPFTVSPDGTISQNGQAVTRMSVYRFQNPEILQRGNGSYFIDANNEGGVQPVEFPVIRQYQLEMSSVAPLMEMVSMMEVSRAYEITQKLIQEDDERVGKAIQTFTV